MKQSRFGSSAAGVVLEDLLKIPENKRYDKNIASLVIDLYRGLNFLYRAPDRSTFETMYILWRKEFINRVRNLELPKLIEDHLLSTITGICRQKRREYMITNGKLGKNQRKKLIEEYKKHYEDFIKKSNS